MLENESPETVANVEPTKKGLGGRKYKKTLEKEDSERNNKISFFFKNKYF